MISHENPGRRSRGRSQGGRGGGFNQRRSQGGYPPGYDQGGQGHSGPESSGSHHSSHPISNEETLGSERVQIERKLFILTLKENPRGRFLRITEDVGGRRDHVIIPATGLRDFQSALEAMIAIDEGRTSDSHPGSELSQQDSYQPYQQYQGSTGPDGEK